MSTDLIVSADYAPTVAANFAETWAEEMGDEQPEFPRVKVPGAGGAAWEIPTGDPENPDVVKEFAGIIVAHHPTSRLYLDRFEDRDSTSTGRPDAWSIDGKTQIVPEATVLKAQERGLPVPTTDLASCPYNQFGSTHLVGGSGNSKATRNYHEVYVYLGGDAVFPVQLSIPATSIKTFKSYLSLAVLAQGHTPSSVVTSFGLKKVQSGGGIDYSTITFKNVSAVDADIAAKLKAYSNEIKAIVRNDPFARLAGPAAVSSADAPAASAPAGDDFDL